MAFISTSKLQSESSNKLILKWSEICREKSRPLNVSEPLKVPSLNLDSIEQESLILQDETQHNLLTASVLQQIHNSLQLNTIRAAFVGSPHQKTSLKLYDQALRSTTKAYLELKYCVPVNGTQLPVQVFPHLLYLYDHYLQLVDNMTNKDQAGAIYQEGMNIVQHQLASSGETLTTAALSNTVATLTSQTPQTATIVAESKRQAKSISVQQGVKGKKGRSLLRKQMQTQHSSTFQKNENQKCQIDLNFAITQYHATNQKFVNGTVPLVNFCLDLDSETESNDDTTFPYTGLGYVREREELVELFINQGADIEHCDEKGYMPLIVAAVGGDKKVVDILLKNGADIEVQTCNKNTPLSIACVKGDYEVAKLLLNRGANKEHRNESNYTPLDLAALSGYVNVIKLLLNRGAEINSQTGSKLGISPLMLAAGNGHTAAVKLLLNMGSDINAQTKTNRNTALTFACFQGHHGVVSLLLDRKANVEHRTKTGLTPLMAAARGDSGSHVEVGRILLEKGVDVNATSVPSFRDTALTIAAARGNCQFVKLLLRKGAAVEVKKKEGTSPLWLAVNGGHLSVAVFLYNSSADIDSQDNRKVSCLMTAFQKGHVEVVKWMVNHVTLFPSDQEMMKYFSTIDDTELLSNCRQCINIITAAKDTQAIKANKMASMLLEELDKEKNRAESKKAAAARRRERKKKKKLEKKEEKCRLTEENKTNEKYNKDDDKKNMDEDTDKLDDEENLQERTGSKFPILNGEAVDKKKGDSRTDAISDNIKTKEKQKEKKKKKSSQTCLSDIKKSELEFGDPLKSARNSVVTPSKVQSSDEFKDMPEKRAEKGHDTAKNLRSNQTIKKGLIFEATCHPTKQDDFEGTRNETYVPARNKKSHLQHYSEILSLTSKPRPKQSSEGGKGAVQKSSVQTVTTNDSRVRKVSVPFSAISRVIGRGGSNINAIRGATGAHIEVETQNKGQGERIITLKGSVEATKQAESLIVALIEDPNVNILQILSETNKSAAATFSSWDEVQLGTEKISVKVVGNVSQPIATTTTAQQKTLTITTPAPSRSTAVIKPSSSIIAIVPQITAPHLVAQTQRNAAAQLASNTKNIMSYTTAIMTTTRATTKVITTTAAQTFAAKLTETTSSSQMPVSLSQTFQYRKTRASQSINVEPLFLQSSMQTINNQTSLKLHHPTPTASVPPNIQHYQPLEKFSLFSSSSTQPSICTGVEHSMSAGLRQSHGSTPQLQPALIPVATPHVEALPTTQISNNLTPMQEYSLFNFMVQQPTWRQETETEKTINFAALTGGATSQTPTNNFVDNNPPPQVDAWKAPGYRGTAKCLPVSSKTSINITTPPSLPLISGSNYQSFPEQLKNQLLAPISTNIMHNRSVSQENQYDMSSNHHYSSTEVPSQSMQHADSDKNLYKSGSASFKESTATNMLIIPMNNVEQHRLSSYHQPSSIQHFNYSQLQQQPMQISTAPITMSRLNPEAPDFVMHALRNEQPPQIYNEYAMGNQNSSTLHAMDQSGMGNYHKSAMGTPQSRLPLLQMQQPFSQQQSELINRMAGMTLHSFASAARGETLENDVELGTVNSSLAMSPNLPLSHNLLPSDGHYIVDCKQSEPIGTEEALESQNPNMDNNWVISNDSNMIVGPQWAGTTNIDRYPMLRNQMNADHISLPLDSFQQGVPLEIPHNCANGAPFQTYLLQQQQMTNMRPLDFVPTDLLTMELSQWDTSPM